MSQGPDIHRSSVHYGQNHWPDAYDEKYYNNLPLHCTVFRVVFGGDAPAPAPAPAPIYKVWSADVKGLMGSGATIDDAKTDFWVCVSERIFNRIGGIYLLSEPPLPAAIQGAMATIRRDHKDATAIDIVSDFEQIVIQASNIARC